MGKQQLNCMRKVTVTGGVVWFLLSAVPVAGLETDPYTNRDMDVADSLMILDAKVNEALDEIAATWSRGENERAFSTAVYRKLGGRHVIDRLERWAMRVPDVDRIPISRRESVFASLPFHTIPTARIVATSRTINVNGSYVGTDKIGHFFSQGIKFYSRYRRLGTEELAAKRTAAWERSIFGGLTSGIYSNADLVANYEGFLFYRGLFGDDVIAGKPAMFRWQDGRPVRQRAFTWADHVNGFWDEMLNPSSYRRNMVGYMQRRMLRLCADYELRPDRYRMTDREALSKRYRFLGMRDSPSLQPSPFLNQNCPRTAQPIGY